MSRVQDKTCFKLSLAKTRSNHVPNNETSVKYVNQWTMDVSQAPLNFCHLPMDQTGTSNECIKMRTPVKNIDNQNQDLMVVLQIDDDRDDLEIFGEAIKSFDSTIEYCGFDTIETALAFLDKDDAIVADVIFLDINMPRYSGFECYTMLKKTSRIINTRFVFLSTTINRKDIPPGCDFMLKQHSEKNYVTVLKNFLKPLQA